MVPSISLKNKMPRFFCLEYEINLNMKVIDVSGSTLLWRKYEHDVCKQFTQKCIESAVKPQNPCHERSPSFSRP